MRRLGAQASSRNIDVACDSRIRKGRDKREAERGAERVRVRTHLQQLADLPVALYDGNRLLLVGLEALLDRLNVVIRAPAALA